MSYRLMFMINAIVAAICGALLLAVPQPFLLFFGVSDAYVSTLTISRLFGGSLIIIAALLWFLKDSGKELLKTESAAMMVASFAGAILIVLDLLSEKGIFRANGWMMVVLFLLLAAGYAYLVFGVTVKIKKTK